MRKLRIAFLISILTLVGLGSSRLAAQTADCQVEFSRSRKPLDVASYFSWYYDKSQFKCMSTKPLEGSFESEDEERIRKHLGRLKDHGFDAILAVIYADPNGKLPPSRDMQNLVLALDGAEREGLQFIPMLDLSISAYWHLDLCNPFAVSCPEGSRPIEAYNFDRYPKLKSHTRETLVMIADRFITPYMNDANPTRSTVRFLTDKRGNLVTDSKGRPRPEIYLYIARSWTDDNNLKTIKKTIKKVTRKYKRRGLGPPAFTLDVIEDTSAAFAGDLISAFGDTVVALTSFFQPHPGSDNLGDLMRETHQPMYQRAEVHLAELIATGEVPADLQIAAGTVVNFDKRKWAQCNDGFGNLAWPARGPDDVLEAFMTAVNATVEPNLTCADGAGEAATPFRNKRFVYADEGFEGTWLCAKKAGGKIKYPNKYGCQPLDILQGLLEEIGER